MFDKQIAGVLQNMAENFFDKKIAVIDLDGDKKPDVEEAKQYSASILHGCQGAFESANVPEVLRGVNMVSEGVKLVIASVDVAKLQIGLQESSESVKALAALVMLWFVKFTPKKEGK